MTEPTRRSFLPAAPRPAGAGWEVLCPACGALVPRAGDSLLGARGAAPWWVSRPLATLGCGLLGLGPTLAVAFAQAGDLGPFVLLLLPLYFLWTSPLSVPLAILAIQLHRRLHPRLAGAGVQWGTGVEVTRAWRDITRLRGRRGVVVSLSLQAAYLQGERLEVLVRFRGPDGRYLPGELRNYRGARGEVLARWRSAPLQNLLAVFERIWVFLPMRALGLPPGTREVQLDAEILVVARGEVRAEVDLPLHFRPLPEDFPHLLPAGPAGGTPGSGEADPDALRFLEAGPAAAEASLCGVCGDPLEGSPTTRCGLCDSPHHPECWEYLGGCSTYACEGRPVD